MALVDADYKFIYVDVGAQGRVGDAGVYANCKLSRLLEDNKLHVPPSKLIPGIEQPIPYTIVADDAFPLRTFIMKPFKGRNLEKRQENFNYRLSRARRMVENAFGVLANRFRIYRSPILLSPSNAKQVVLATVVLHNMLRTKTKTDSDETTGEQSNIKDAAENNVENRTSTATIGALQNLSQYKGRMCTDAKQIREYLADYFLGPGFVPWQGVATGYQQRLSVVE